MWSNGFGKLLSTLLISMVPVVELRGAIPAALAQGVPAIPAALVSIVGNLLPVPFIIVFVRRVFAWIRHKMPKLDGFVSRLEQRAEAKSESVRKYSFWGLFLFVAIPLPGTGAWTGALIAAMLEMRLKHALPAIILGVLTAAVIVTLASLGVIHLVL